MTSTRLWYIYACTGSEGFLLDLIVRPDRAVARLAVFAASGSSVLRADRPLSTVVRGEDPHTVRLDTIELSARGCRGRLDGIDIDVELRLSRETFEFGPRWVSRLFGSVPSLSSRYGRLERGTCQGTAYAGLPIVYSTYGVRRIEKSIWLLISALQFPDTDLSIEISAVRIGSWWAVSAFCRYRGKLYHLNGVWTALFRSRVKEAGIASHGERRLHIACRTREITIDILGNAPEEDFVLLEREGNTEVRTTLFGSCRVEVTVRELGAGPQIFKAERTCLLEVKGLT